MRQLRQEAQKKAALQQSGRGSLREEQEESLTVGNKTLPLIPPPPRPLASLLPRLGEMHAGLFPPAARAISTLSGPAYLLCPLQCSGTSKDGEGLRSCAPR